jgi:hypothetical protein
METIENKNERRSFYCGHRRKGIWIAMGIIGFTGLAFLFGAIIMWLWNGLMPLIFHLGVITFWQAVGLAILARLLFGGFHHGHNHYGHHRYGPWRHRYYMRHDKNCRNYSNGTKWSYYEQYWNEEGEKAFDEYIKHKTEDQGKPE